MVKHIGEAVTPVHCHHITYAIVIYWRSLSWLEYSPVSIHIPENIAISSLYNASQLPVKKKLWFVLPAFQSQDALRWFMLKIKSDPLIQEMPYSCRMLWATPSCHCHEIRARRHAQVCKCHFLACCLRHYYYHYHFINIFCHHWWMPVTSASLSVIKVLRWSYLSFSYHHVLPFLQFSIAGSNKDYHAVAPEIYNILLTTLIRSHTGCHYYHYFSLSLAIVCWSHFSSPAA